MEVREAVQELASRRNGRPAGTTLVLVTHHVEEIPPALTHALVLRQGQVLAAGPKHDVLTGAILSRAFDLPIEVDCRHGRYWPRVAGHRSV